MTALDPALGPLAPATLAAYLTRLGVEPPKRPDLAALKVLQAAHLRAVPFHNIALLAAAGRDPGLPPIAAAVEGALRGHGGTCHVLSPPFAVLLRSLGFEAHLAAAAVGAPGDHIVVIVHLEGQRWLCDVANGHPYLTPFPLDSTDTRHDQTAYGWHFRLEALHTSTDSAPTHRLLRRMPDEAWKVVYTLTPQMMPYSSFTGIIVDHHTRVGFGPFLTGLRAVRMTEDRLLCLRDCWLERYGVGPPGRRFLPNIHAVGTILNRHFGLGELPWQDALRTLDVHTKRWWPVCSPSEIHAVATSQVPPLLRLLVSVGLMDRPGALWTLGQGLLRDGLGRHNDPAGAGILAFENSADPTCIRDNKAAAIALSAAGLPTQVGEDTKVYEVRRRLMGAGFCAESQRLPRASIALNRMMQVGLLADCFEQAPSRGGLPHPGDLQGPIAVWMLDDDLLLERLERTPNGLSAKPVLDLRGQLDRLYRDHPEISVLIGGNTGCPPIPGFCFLQTQILDLVTHVAAASHRVPDEPYVPRSNPRHLPDYYYDTSDAGDVHLDRAFDWEPAEGNGSLSVGEALLSHLRAFPSLLHGQPATRLLVHEAEAPIVPTTARGGNAVFFDLDALFAAPYLAVPLTDRTVTRRSDTVWAHLAGAAPGVSIFHAPFPVHHRRNPGDGSGPTLTSPSEDWNLRQFMLAQLGGVVFSRLVAAQLRGQALDPLILLHQRLAVVRSAFAAATQHIAQFDAGQYLQRSDLWWSRSEHAPVRSELVRTAEILERLRNGVLASEVTTAAELSVAAHNLAQAVAGITNDTKRWRGLWS